jgi:hypothetical protein
MINFKLSHYPGISLVDIDSEAAIMEEILRLRTEAE